MKMVLEYSDLSSNMRVRGNHNSVLGKTMMCKHFTEKMKSYEYGCLRSPYHCNYIVGRYIFTKCTHITVPE